MTLIADMEAHLREAVVPKLMEDQVFGPAFVLRKLEVAALAGFGEHYFGSRIFKLTLHLNKENESTSRIVNLIAKFITEVFGIYADGDLCGRNEVEMYKRIIPFLNKVWDQHVSDCEMKPGIFINCYWAQQDPYYVLVMDDMTCAGFQLAKSRHSLDLPHVLLAMRRVGAMHALSYAAKVKRKTELLKVAGCIKESRFTEGTIEENVILFRLSSIRRIERLIQSGDLSLPEDTLNRLKNKLQDSRDIVAAALSPEEPWSVIVHGDFCRNNLLFKYNSESGLPEDIRFLDFQTPRYCSPSVDLAFFIYLNTTSELRSEHWDNFFNAYHDELTKTFKKIVTDESEWTTDYLPSRDQVDADFKRHALFSFLLCAYFLPMMMTPADEQPSVRELTRDGRAGMSPQELIANIGGRNSELLVKDLLLEFLQRGMA